MTAHAHPAPYWLRLLAWLPLVIALALALTTLAIHVTVCAPDVWRIAEDLGWLPAAFSPIAFGVLCGLIVPRQPHNRIGWLCGVIAVAPMLVGISLNVPLQCEARGLITLPGVTFLAWLSAFGSLAISAEFFLLPLWFPDGRFLSTGWRRFALGYYILVSVCVLLMAVWPGPLFYYQAMQINKVVNNPFGLPFHPSPGLTLLLQRSHFAILLVGIIIAQFSLFSRWRRSHGQTRQQVKVFAFYVVTIGTVYMLFELSIQFFGQPLGLVGGGWVYMALLVLLWVGYPFAVGVSVLKYRMYDVDVVIRKTLVYSTLTALLALVYFGCIVALQGLFAKWLRVEQSTLAIVVSTLVIAALFAPLRRRIQDSIDRRFFRRKYDAQQVLANFARSTRDETDLNALLAELTRVVDETLQPEHVSIWLKDRGTKRS